MSGWQQFLARGDCLRAGVYQKQLDGAQAGHSLRWLGACFLVSGNWPAASVGILGPADLVSFLQTLRLCAPELCWPCGFPDSFDPREAMASMLPLMARPLLKPRGLGPGIAKCCLQPQRWSPAFKATFWGETAAASSYQ